jgi:hypothetical protein
MRLRNLVALALTALTALAVPAGAQNLSGLEEPLVGDRPDFTESPDTIPRGHFQVETGVTFQRVDEDEAFSLGEVLVRIGGGERWEARIDAGSYLRVDTPNQEARGFADPGIGIKVKLNEGDDATGRPQAALLLGTSVPVGDEDLTSDAWEPEAILALAWTLTRRLSLASNLGLALPEGDDGRFEQLSASLAAGLALTDRAGLFLEAFGFSEEVEGGEGTVYLDAGATWLLSNDIQLDLRVGTGLNEPSPEWFAGAGAIVRW